ncbi:hypothetical protein AJ80_07426 [Polytolypa hystricis UAMH7299]|uniref:Integral membrane protein n=1 Tax=Polytolypa hystricis (strain UAMH7299) TaxID=1447883 RepID=A0A2B7XP11_POLH7|nr:hypothetical protein AJ80_07426 [Polytolypa hystricis UAMH7299]
MNPHISVPRPYAGPSNFGSMPASRGSTRRMPRFFRRLFKFAMMDFEVAIWEMTSLLIAPKKVFKSMYYHKRTPDPSFTYLLSFFLLLTAIAWGIAYTPSFHSILTLSTAFVFIHFIATSLLVSTIAYFAMGRIFGPGGPASRIMGLRGGSGGFGRIRRRGAAQGLFAQPGEIEHVEFGYCFDVSNRAFFPLYLHLYVLQFLLLPILTRNSSSATPSDASSPTSTPSASFLATFLGNTLYLSAFTYYTYITFLGYNALPFLHHTELLLLPILVFAVLWLVSLIVGWGIVGQGGAVKWLFWLA